MTTDTTNTSTSSVISSIIFNSAFFGAFVGLFILLRLKLKRIYQPKSSFDLINDEKKPQPLPSGLWQWVIPLLKKSDNFVIQQAGIDGYFFLRYLFIMSAYCGVSMIYIFPILLPIDAVDGVTDSSFDLLTFSNVKSSGRYYAHLFCGWVFFWGFLFVIYRELVYYTQIRNVILSSPRYAKKLSSRTVLFQSVPEQYLSESEFSKLFENVKRVWIARGTKELTKLVEEREALTTKLENALTSYIKAGVKTVHKRKSKGDQTVSGAITDYIPDKKRPKHRLKPIFGKKVDTINYAKETLPELNKKIKKLQANHMEAKPMNSVFVEFNTQYDAQIASQMIVHHSPLQMCPSYVGIDHSEIHWFNLRMHWLERIVRKFGGISVIVALLILWAFPVAFVGMISNITYLTNKVPWLDFIYNLPDALLGILTSITPTVALAVLMLLVPIFIRKMAVVIGAPSTYHVEHFTQQAYFAFQVIQVFLVTTLASSATSTVTDIVEDPTSAMSLLAENLPKSSNFYISYILLQGLSISSGLLLQIAALLVFYILGFLLDSTPRKKYNRFTKLRMARWGSVFPKYTNLAVITFSYSIISPLILLFACVGFFLLYVAYLYNLTYVFKEAPEARGANYPRALFQTMVGLYIGQICLLGLFVVGKGWGPIVLQAIGLGVTVFIHLNLNTAFDNLMKSIPIDTMKPLDGKSNTPSYTFANCNNDSNDEIKELPPFPIKKYNARSSLQIDQRTTSVLSENTYEIQTGPFEAENENNITSVPLLAEGVTTTPPYAPFWKRFFRPDIYYSYNAVKTRIPEIYNLPDPTELKTESEQASAYNYPTVSAKCPVLWIPKDPYGFSTHEIANLSAVITVTDEGAFINEKGRIRWTDPPQELLTNIPADENPFNETIDDTVELSKSQ